MYRESTLGTEWDEIEIPHDMQAMAQAIPHEDARSGLRRR